MNAWSHLSLAQRALAFRDLGRARQFAEQALREFDATQLVGDDEELEPDSESIARYQKLLDEQVPEPEKPSRERIALSDVEAGKRVAQLISQTEPDVFANMYDNLLKMRSQESSQVEMVFLSLVRSDGTGEISAYPPSLETPDFFGRIKERLNHLDQSKFERAIIRVLDDSGDTRSRKDDDRVRLALFGTDFSAQVLVLKTPFCQIHGRLFSVPDTAGNRITEVVEWLYSLLA